MHKQIGVFFAACFYYSGLVKLARWWTQRSDHRLIILAYHRASEGDLRQHLLYLRRHYRVLHLEEALEELYMLPQGKLVHDPRTPLVLTFDDGYRDNFTHGFALARELQVPMTIFLVPAYIESGESFWWLEGKRLVRRARVHKVTIDGISYSLNRPEERNMLAQVIDTRLRQARSIGERDAFLAAVCELLEVSTSISAEEEALQPLTWREVRKMEASGWVSFGGHSMHHPILAYLTDPTEMEFEVEECRRVLEKQLGHAVRTFAYPVGKPEHIGGEAPRAVRDAGYDWAVTTIHGVNTPQNDPYLLRRVSTDVSRHWLVMAAEAAGIWRFFSRLHRLSLGPIRTMHKHFFNARMAMQEE